MTLWVEPSQSVVSDWLKCDTSSIIKIENQDLFATTLCRRRKKEKGHRYFLIFLNKASVDCQVCNISFPCACHFPKYTAVNNIITYILFYLLLLYFI